MKKTMMMSFSVLMMIGATKASFSAAQDVQVDIIKLQSMEQTELEGLNLKAQSGLQNMAANIQSLAQSHSQMIAQLTTLQKKIAELQKEINQSVQKTESDMASQIKMIQSSASGKPCPPAANDAHAPSTPKASKTKAAAPAPAKK